MYCGGLKRAYYEAVTKAKDKPRIESQEHRPPPSPHFSNISNSAFEGSHPKLKSPLKTMDSSDDMRDSDSETSESEHEHSPPKCKDTNKTECTRVGVSEIKKSTSAPNAKIQATRMQMEYSKLSPQTQPQAQVGEINHLTDEISQERSRICPLPYRCDKIAGLIIAAWVHQV